MSKNEAHEAIKTKKAWTSWSGSIFRVQKWPRGTPSRVRMAPKGHPLSVQVYMSPTWSLFASFSGDISKCLFSLNLEGPVWGLPLTEDYETQTNSQQGEHDRALIGYKHSLVEHDRHEEVCARNSWNVNFAKPNKNQRLCIGVGRVVYRQGERVRFTKLETEVYN